MLAWVLSLMTCHYILYFNVVKEITQCVCVFFIQLTLLDIGCGAELDGHCYIVWFVWSRKIRKCVCVCVFYIEFALLENIVEDVLWSGSCPPGVAHMLPFNHCCHGKIVLKFVFLLFF